jgi:hypothetical protein
MLTDGDRKGDLSEIKACGVYELEKALYFVPFVGRGGDLVNADRNAVEDKADDDFGDRGKEGRDILGAANCVGLSAS